MATDGVAQGARAEPVDHYQRVLASDGGAIERALHPVHGLLHAQTAQVDSFADGMQDRVLSFGRNRSIGDVRRRLACAAPMLSRAMDSLLTDWNGLSCQSGPSSKFQ